MLPITKMITNYNKSPRDGRRIKGIFIHDVGAVSSARNNAMYFNGGNRNASADFFVDSTSIYQIIDYNTHYSWAIGDGGGRNGFNNSDTVSIEMCLESNWKPSEATVNNTIDLVKYLMSELGLSVNEVYRHYDASYKSCPNSFRDNNWAKWHEFKSRLSNNSNPTPPPTTNKGEYKVGNYGGSVVVTADVLNVRSGRGSEHNIIGQVYNRNTLTVNYILNDNRDGSGNDDLWGSINFKGMTGFIHLGYTKPTTQSVPTPPPVIEEPKPTPPSCDTELNRYSENGRCTIVANSGIRFRDKPCTCHGVQQGIYGCGESVSYDLVVITEKYIWISWIGASSGARRYMPIKDKNTNERWGNCV